MDKINEWIKLLLAVLPLFSPTAEGRVRRQRRRRYKALKRLRDKRDREKISAQRYAEELKDINERYKQ